MKAIRKITKSPVISLILILTVLLYSCGQETVMNKQNQFSGKELMRAVYFLDGNIVDKIEPLVDIKLENVFDSEQVSKMREHIDILLDQIESSNPGTFEIFKAEITSGDHLIISQSISRNARLIYSVIKEMNNGNEEFLSLIEEGSQPLAQIIESHFPAKNNSITSDQIKEGIKSDSFKNDISLYFQNLEGKINGRSNQVEDQMCVLWGAAVVAFAAIAVAVIYVVVVLNAVETANIIDYIWATERSSATSSLLKEQIVNSIATNLYVAE